MSYHDWMKRGKVKTVPHWIIDFMGIDEVTLVMFLLMELFLIAGIVIFIIDRT